MKKHVRIFTDGACQGNPGPGGWGAILYYGRIEKKIMGGELDTTNNRMELTAVIAALSVPKESCQVDLTTDSLYVRDGITKWVPEWQQRNWQTRAGHPIKNRDLWQQLVEAASQHEIVWHWVRGHMGHPENELADKLAREGLVQCLSQKQDKE